MILFFVRTMAEVLLKCYLKVRVLPKVTSKYFGVQTYLKHCAVKLYRCLFVIKVAFSFE